MNNFNIHLPWSITGLLILILIYVIFNPEKTEKLLSWVLKFFRNVSHRFECAHVAKYIESRINHFSKKLNSETKGSLLAPYKLKIEWVTEANREAFLRNGELIVKMGYHENQDRNFVTATLVYISKGVIPHARSYIDKKISRGIDFTLTKKIIIEEKVGKAIDYFIEDVLNPVIQEEPEIRQYCSILEDINESGLLEVILLREFHEMGKKLYPKIPREEFHQETKDFLKFIYKIATKEKGVDIDLNFQGQYIHAAVVLVARPGVFETYGARPYLDCINKCLKKKIETIYICGLGKNVDDAKYVCKRASNINEIEKVTQTIYDITPLKGRKVKAIAAMFKVKEETLP